MSADLLVDTATSLAYLVRCSTPDEVRHAITHDIRDEDKDALLVLLAGLIDIDRTRRQLLDDIRQSPTLGGIITSLQRARIQSYEPSWVAWKHGDRDPNVVHRAHQYEQHQGAA